MRPWLLGWIVGIAACSNHEAPTPTPREATHQATLPGNDRPAIPGHTMVFDYADFGPQAFAFELGLGFEWSSWIGIPCPDADPEQCLDVEYDIKVVVYREMSEDEVRRAYPTSPGVSDYRLVDHATALGGIDEALETTRDEPSLRAMRMRLISLRSRIAAGLGE